ncbi:MAG: T9SS type A sorting domain-containing protein [Flavobacteriales bacterium]|nr:MAG: T9SS type A sorting domain-containing protein [Flavobacteriales bacterium]
MLLNAGGDIETLTPAHRADLLALATNAEQFGAADAWAWRLFLGETDSLPWKELPEAMRYPNAPKPDRPRFSLDALLNAVPNPASDRVVLAYPAGFEQGVIEVWAADGRLVDRKPLLGSPAGVEVDVRTLPVGLYMASLTMDGLRVAETKFSVVR